MFQKLRTTTFLKVHGDANATSIGFAGRIARIARVHQYGLKDRAKQRSQDVKYAQREILGLTQDDLQLIRDILLIKIA